MTQHPSLTKEIDLPEPIFPSERMLPYTACWCRSGKKYKFCHFRRDQQIGINIYELEQKLLAELNRGYCSYPSSTEDECSGGISQAHTVQRRGGLTAIAESGHVLSVKVTMKGMIEHEGMQPPRRVGLSQASVFPGFCNKHDTKIFRPVEVPEIDLNPNNAFLLAYRAVAYERFAKEAQMRSLAAQREMDMGQPLEKQVAIQNHIYAHECGIKLGMRDIDLWKTEYDQRLVSGSLDSFKFTAVRFNRVLPVVACGAFFVECDFEGNALQKLGTASSSLEHITLTMTAYEDQTVAILGWVGSDDGPAAKFAASFRELSHDRISDALIRLAFEKLENIFLQQTWWDGLAENNKSDLIKRSRSGTAMLGRRSDCLVDRGTSYFAADVVEILHN